MGVSFAAFMPQAKSIRGLVLRSAASGVLLTGPSTPAKHGGPSFFFFSQNLGAIGYHKLYVSQYAVHEAIV